MDDNELSGTAPASLQADHDREMHGETSDVPPGGYAKSGLVISWLLHDEAEQELQNSHDKVQPEVSSAESESNDVRVWLS